MTIRKKSKEELQEQAKWFLDYVDETWNITEKQRKKISKILWLNESEKKWLIERLSKRLWKELDISDKEQIEKILKKKNIDFDRVWKEYTDYLRKKSVDKHNNEIKQKVESFFEPYKTPFPDANVIIINEIVENYSKNTIEKAKIFFTSNLYKIACKWAIKNETFFKDFMESVDNCDDLKFLLDSFSYDDLFEARLSKKLQNFNINAIKNSILYWFDYQEIWIEDLDCMDIRTFENNMLLLINNWYDYKNISLSISDLESIDIAQYIKVLEDCNIAWFWETFDINDEWYEDIRNILLELKGFTKEYLLQLCVQCWIVSINWVLSHTPNIHYENNGGYVGKTVHIDDGGFSSMIETIRFAWKEDYSSNFIKNEISEKDKILLYLWTTYWTNNWKKNIDFAFEKWLINWNDILPAYEDLDLNANIAHLKLIKNSMLVDLVNKWTNQEEFISFIRNCSDIYRRKLEYLLENFPNIKFEDITINKLILLKDILSSNYVKENLPILLEKFPNIKFKDITIDKLILLKDILSSSCVKENLSILLEKFPNIKTEDMAIDGLISLSGMLSSEFTEWNIKVLSENCLCEINSIEELLLLNGIISNVEYPKILKLVFEKYPWITVKQLSSLEKVLVWMRMTNRNVINNKYQNLEIEKLWELGDILSENTDPESLWIIFKKYPSISISELIRFKNIVRNNSKGSIQQIDNFWDSIPWAKSMNILSLFNDDTKTHDEIFENIENKDEINDDNWIDIIWLYSAIEYFEDDKTISDEIKSSIRELINNEDKKDSIKDFIYKKLFELLKKSMSDKSTLNDEEIALLAVLNKKWLWNMWQSESLAKFIYQINKLDKNYKFNKAFIEIKWEIGKFIDSHKKDSNELINSFYQISTSLLERSPAIYRNVLKLLNKLNSEEQELFYKEIFPLYNVELFLWEKSWQYKLLWKKVNNNVEWQLIPMHERINMLLNKLDTNKQIDVNSLLLEEKNYLVENIKQLFNEKFWIKKIPAEFTNENIESIRWHSIYLSNMHDRDEEKSAVLWYFLALKLDGKRTEFRTWKDFDPSEYMEDSKVPILREYLSKRSERNSVYKLENIEENDKIFLQENESNTIIWNTNWITDRLKTIEGNIKTLLDDDIYSERQKIIKKYVDKDLGKLLAKQFQLLSGKNIVIDDEENKILSDLSNKLWENLTDIKNVQKLQNECKPISAIVNFVNKILNENLSREIQDFENLCKPSDNHLKLLKKIWVNLEDDSIVSSNSYLTYVESWIRKWKNKLTQEEYNSLNEYIVRVNKELDDLYGIKDKLTTLYEDFKNKIIDKYFDNTELKERFESMSPYFFTKADVEKENIVSLMTNDLDIVIKNIRQCLWCKDRWCNNDTDLSFGCDDRFFITTSHREGDTSFADELVTLLPREPREDWFTFVMDKIYWNNWSMHILLNNIYVILKKINKLSPELRKQLSIFVPNNIGLNLNEEWIEKIKKQYNWVIIEKKDITVTVNEQPITDSYHEFGWIDCRSTWDATISWYLIKIK